MDVTSVALGEKPSTSCFWATSSGVLVEGMPNMRKVVNVRAVSFYEIRIFRLPKMISGNVSVDFHIFFFTHKRTCNLMCKQKDQDAYYKAEKT